MLKLFNSDGKKLELFEPLKDKRIGIYVCGPTVYSSDHLGQARTWIFFDWLRRYLTLSGFKVKFVQNITDVGHLVGDAETGEDKIEKEAKAKNKKPEEIARRFEAEHFKDLEALNILRPNITPRATEHISDMVNFIETLIKKKNAYVVSGNVYFDVASFTDYGKFSGRKIDEEKIGSRVKVDKKKKNPADFVLWLKADSSHLQKWPSPWGEGYPGWHIECSVIASRYLGQPFEIHGGGADLKFPHHENEIAQSVATTGKPLAKYWLHGGMLLINGQKMAKSLGNFITIKDALAKYDPDTIKIAFMSTHWRKPFNWEKSAVSEAKKIRERLVRAKEQSQAIITGYKTEINVALENDFNVPQVLAVVMKNISKLSRDDFRYFEELFGLKLKEAVRLTPKQEKLYQERITARQEGNYQKADEIRKNLEKQGVMLEDTPMGTRIYK
ncbi:MAG: cysteine--tRNA ligase [Patescibacteria group bacterium]|jgi:cysteinyl-tRNA synthetase